MTHTEKILIVDDDVLITEHLKDLLISVGYRNIRMVHDKKSALDQLDSFSPQLVLLDIRMKEEREGISIGKLIQDKYNIPFLYITAHSDVAMMNAALETNPSGYITKPFKKIDIMAAVKVGLQSTEKVGKVFFNFKEGYRDVRINIEEIMYVESDGNYIHIYTDKTRHLLRNSLEWFLENVPEKHFMRVHRSYAVNTKRVESVSATHVTVSGKKIPASRIHLPLIKSSFFGS